MNDSLQFRLLVIIVAGWISREQASAIGRPSNLTAECGNRQSSRQPVTVWNLRH